MQKSFGHYIRYINEGLKNNFNSLLAKEELTSQQAFIILYIINNKDEEINQKKLEEVFELKSSTISGLLKRLEIKGMISKEISKSDNRNKVIKCTKKAYQLKDILDTNKMLLEKKLLHGLTDVEITNFWNVLIKIKNNIKEME